MGVVHVAPRPFLRAGFDSPEVENGTRCLCGSWARGEARGSQEGFEMLRL